MKRYFNLLLLVGVLVTNIKLATAEEIRYRLSGEIILQIHIDPPEKLSHLAEHLADYLASHIPGVQKSSTHVQETSKSLTEITADYLVHHITYPIQINAVEIPVECNGQGFFFTLNHKDSLGHFADLKMNIPIFGAISKKNHIILGAEEMSLTIESGPNLFSIFHSKQSKESKKLSSNDRNISKSNLPILSSTDSEEIPFILNGKLNLLGLEYEFIDTRIGTASVVLKNWKMEPTDFVSLYE